MDNVKAKHGWEENLIKPMENKERVCAIYLAKKNRCQKPFKDVAKTKVSSLGRKKPPPNPNTVDPETV